jgi:uncharacterized membrane protein
MRAFLAVLGLAFVILALSSILLPGIGGILVLILVGACLVWIGLGFDTQAPGSERYLGPIRGWATGQAARGRFTVCGFIAAGISAAYMVVGIANRLLMPATVYPHRAFHIATFTFQVYPVLLVIAGSALLGRFVDLYFRRERRGAGIILLGAFAMAFLLVMNWTFVFLVNPVTGTPGLLMTVVFWVVWVGVYLLFSFGKRSGAKVQPFFVMDREIRENQAG